MAPGLVYAIGVVDACSVYTVWCTPALLSVVGNIQACRSVVSARFSNLLTNVPSSVGIDGTLTLPQLAVLAKRGTNHLVRGGGPVMARTIAT